MQCGRGVVDARVGVGDAAAVHDEQAVEHALAALALEAHVDVVARERSTEHERVVEEAGVAAEPHGERRHVQRAFALPLQLVVVDLGAVLEHDLGHRVRERGRARPRGEDLDDPGLAAAPGHDDRARVGGGCPRGPRRRARRGSERSSDRARRDQHHGRVVGEGGVELGEDRRAVAATRASQGSRLAGREASASRRLIAATPGLRRPSATARATRRPFTNTSRGPRGVRRRQERQHVGRGSGRGIGRLEARAHERRQRRVAPGLVARRGRPASTKRAKAAVRRSRSHAGSDAAGVRQREALEARAVGVLLGAHGAHGVTSRRPRPAPSRARRSPSPRARAPSPCRRSGRCGRRPARGRSRARCGRAAAGSG